MPAHWAALRYSGISASMRSSSASEAEYPNICVAFVFQKIMRWLLASATITASRILSNILPMPRSSGFIVAWSQSVARYYFGYDYSEPRIKRVVAQWWVTVCKNDAVRLLYGGLEHP